jgi:hypothetical protein
MPFSPLTLTLSPKGRGGPKSRFRELSLRGNRSNIALFNEIAAHLSGARNDTRGKRFLFLNRDLGGI